MQTIADAAIADAAIAVSFVISTHNRRDVLLSTLATVQRCGLHVDAFETIVVDNASRDGSSEAIRKQFPDVRLFAEKQNHGSCGKNIGIRGARGRFIVFLDDDSFPRPGSIQRMIQHFEADPQLGAAVFTITLPDGSRECSAYPDVFIGCGTGFRRAALSQVGELPSDFFQQAEEYDLSLRLLDAGWKVQTFDDLHVTHLKSPAARSSRRVMRLDVRNNLILAARRFPRAWVNPFARDWLRRYWWIAGRNNQRMAFIAGAAQGLVHLLVPSSRTISDEAFEQFARIEEIRNRLANAKHRWDIRSVLFVDVGKNILPYWRAAQELGIVVVAIADNKLSKDGRTYRGVPVVTDEEARSYAFDAVIITNTSPVHAALRRSQWRNMDGRMVIDLFEADFGRAITSAGRAASESRQTAARIA